MIEPFKDFVKRGEDVLPEIVLTPAQQDEYDKKEHAKQVKKILQLSYELNYHVKESLDYQDCDFLKLTQIYVKLKHLEKERRNKNAKYVR